METLRLCFHNLLSFYLSIIATLLRWLLSPLPTIKRFPIFIPFIDTYFSLLFRFCNLSPCTLDLDEHTTIHFWAPNHRHFNKPNLVLIHGYGGDAKWQFMYQVKSLSQSFNLYFPDLLFFGKSYTILKERSDKFQAKCMVEGLKGLGVTKCSMYSISYGGYVGYKMAEMYPEIVEKVVILSSGVGCSKEQKEKQLKSIGRDPVDLLIPAKPEDLHVLVNMSIYKYNPFKWVPDAFLQEFIDVLPTCQRIYERYRSAADNVVPSAPSGVGSSSTQANKRMATGLGTFSGLNQKLSSRQTTSGAINELDVYLLHTEMQIDDFGSDQLLQFWKTQQPQFPVLAKMARDILTIQASSVASESAFSQGRLQIGDHRHSLREEALETAVLFRDWIRAERRNFGLPEENEDEDSQYASEILNDSGAPSPSADSEAYYEEDQDLPPVPPEVPEDIINNFKSFFINM